MNRMRSGPRLAAVLAALLVGCSENTGSGNLATGVDEPGDPSFELHCSKQPEGCENEPPPPPAPGYFLGTAITAGTCFSATGININDADYDGMDDYCERRIAEVFRPSMSTAPPSYDCGPTIEPYWAAKYFPISGNLVRIAYLLAYRRDCGNTGIGTALLAKLFQVISLNGFVVDLSTDDPGAGHSGDSEWVMVNVRYNASTMRWALVSVKFSAHDGTIASGTREWSVGGIQIPSGSVYGGYPRVWVALNKHANYVSRESCHTGRGPGGVAVDNCQPVIPDSYRLPFYPYRNVGSVQANMINLGTCVKSVEPLFYPGTECFWRSREPFDGWLNYPYGHPASPYYSSLVMEFECLRVMDYATSTRVCSNWGVNRRT